MGTDKNDNNAIDPAEARLDAIAGELVTHI